MSAKSEAYIVVNSLACYRKEFRWLAYEPGHENDMEIYLK
jgi:hypothetical protein